MESSVTIETWISIWVANFAAIHPIVVVLTLALATELFAVDIEDNRDIPQEPIGRQRRYFTQSGSPSGRPATSSTMVSHGSKLNSLTAVV